MSVRVDGACGENLLMNTVNTVSRHMSLDFDLMMRHHGLGVNVSNSSSDSSPSTVSSPGDVFEAAERYVVKKNRKDEILEHGFIPSAKAIFFSPNMLGDNNSSNSCHRRRVYTVPSSEFKRSLFQKNVSDYKHFFTSPDCYDAQADCYSARPTSSTFESEKNYTSDSFSVSRCVACSVDTGINLTGKAANCNNFKIKRKINRWKIHRCYSAESFVCNNCYEITSNSDEPSRISADESGKDINYSCIQNVCEQFGENCPLQFEKIEARAEKKQELCSFESNVALGNGSNSYGVLLPIKEAKKSTISPDEMKKRIELMVGWFSEFSPDQKNNFLQTLLDHCEQPQFHILSLRMESHFHQGCPPNCQDPVGWLPENVTLQIFALLDPVSLCSASQTCKRWHELAADDSLWKRYCNEAKWRLTSGGEQKQLEVNRWSDGKINWKKVFIERYRLRTNWLKGRCHVRTFEGHVQGISCVQFDDTRIVSGSHDKTIKVWNIRTNSPWSVQTLVGHSGTVRCLHLEGNRLVSGSSDRTIKVWDLSAQQCWSSIACRVTMIGHLDTVRCLQVDDEKIVSGSYDKTLKIWNIRTGQCQLTLRGHEAAVLCVQFDNIKILSGSCDKTIKIWNFSGLCLSTLHGHQDAVTCLQFDSQRIISGSLDCTLKFWDIHSTRCTKTLDWKASEGHTGVVRCLQADSWRVVSASDDRTIKVWNLETGQRLVTLRNHTDGVTCLQFNDRYIVSGSYDRTVKLWDLSCC